MSSRPAAKEYDFRILQSISTGDQVTQRSLASQLGVALGLINSLVRRMVAKGYVRMANVGTRHIRYMMMPAGWEALATATRQSLENTVQLYTQMREQIRSRLFAVAARCEIDASGQRRIVFYGAGDVAEIAYISLQGTGLTLVGVVDDQRTGFFFNVPIVGSDKLSSDALDGRPYAHLLVTTVMHADEIRTRLESLAVAPEKVSYV